MESSLVPSFFYFSSLIQKNIVMIINFKLFISLFLIIYISLAVSAQDRYLEILFDSVEVNTFTYIVKNGEKLDLDIYTPWGDYDENRPVLLYVHGGGFSGGTRNGNDIIEFCKRMAEYGYVTASISYRLTRKGEPTGFGCDCPAEEKYKTFQAAVEDIQDATYYIIQNRETFGIDPHNIILIGSSAGAEAALIAAYSPPNCFDLESGPVAYAGVISMAGAIPHLERVYDESAIPTMFFHGTCDNLVPYATAPHHYCQPSQPGFLVLHGAYTLSRRLEELNVPYWLHTTCGGKNELAGIPISQYFDEIVEFCHDFVLDKKGQNRHTIVPGNAKACDYQQFDFCY
jgi:acetyl esterase/lipase